MIFKTRSGSTYEVDQVNKRIRRLSGDGSPTNRVGSDKEWKQYRELTQLDLKSPIVVGQSALIQWTSQVRPFIEGLGLQPGTITSPIEEIQPETQVN